MFAKKEGSQAPKYDQFDTLIGKTSNVEGNLKTEDTLRIDGEVQGGITSKADVVVGESGKVHGDVSCSNLLLGGRIEGDVVISGQLHITSKGSLRGDANVKIFILDEDGIFEGNCSMQQEGSKKENERASSKPKDSIKAGETGGKDNRKDSNT